MDLNIYHNEHHRFTGDDFDYDKFDINLESDDDEIDENHDEEEEEFDPCRLLKLIKMSDWAGALARISSHPMESRHIGLHGRTPLHYACSNDAPAVVIQALLQVFPESSTMTGTTNMNPLHIACSSHSASVLVVRAFLENGRYEQFSMRDLDGDTPLHTACRCGAPLDVLDVLLRAYSASVHELDYEGLNPVQRLWVRYFVILGVDVIEGVTSSADLVGELLDAWKKTELLLRCAHHGQWENSMIDSYAQFRAVHAAAAVDCPRAIVKIATKVYPYQIHERDENGRTPLMIAAAAPIYKVRNLSDEGYSLEDFVLSSTSSTPTTEAVENLREVATANLENNIDAANNTKYPSVIEILLQANNDNPCQGAELSDPSGRLPLHLALMSGKGWSDGIQQLIEAYPESLCLPDRSSRLYPFMLAASRVNCDISLVYEILRLNPNAIHLLTKNRRMK